MSKFKTHPSSKDTIKNLNGKVTGMEKMSIIHISDKRLIIQGIPSGPAVRPLTAEGLGSILGQGNKIPQAGSMAKKNLIIENI